MNAALDPHIILDRAREHLRSREIPQAIDVLRSLMVLGIEEPPVLELLGVSYSLSGDHEWAIAMFQRVLAVTPDRVPAYVNLGALLVKRGAYSEAIACLERAAQLDQTSSDIYHNLGIAYQETRDWGRAHVAFKAAVRLKPDSTGTLYRLGELCVQTKNFPVAIAYFNKVLEINPQHMRSRHALDQLVQRLAQEKTSNGRSPVTSGMPSSSAVTNSDLRPTELPAYSSGASRSTVRPMRERTTSEVNDIKLLARDIHLKGTLLLDWFDDIGTATLAAFRKQVQNGINGRPAFTTARRDLQSQMKVACEQYQHLVNTIGRLEELLQRRR